MKQPPQGGCWGDFVKSGVKTVLFAVIIASAGLFSGGCGPDSPNPGATLEVPSARSPNASVKGTVTYRERISLTPGGRLVVELRDVSLADASAPLIARQTIPDPGQIPIKFEIGYHRNDINPRNRYAVQARIEESDGRLAFTNDTAYDVITRGNPDQVDMVLVLVQPPPDLLEQVGGADADWRTWVETPARVSWANLVPNEPQPFLRVVYYQSTIEGCARRGSEHLELNGTDIIATITLMQPPATPWSISCDDEVVELDAVMPIPDRLQTGQTYRVLANGRETASFSIPAARLSLSHIAESPVKSADVIFPTEGDAGYSLRVESGLPRGSGCSQFNGYEVRRLGREISVSITHHEVADPSVICTADFPVIETMVPLGTDLEPGSEYSITVNSETRIAFTPP